MSAARIGKITMKNGGASVHVIHQAKQNQDGEANWAGTLLTSARNISANHTKEDPISGYLVVAFFKSGMTCTGFRWGDESPFNRVLLPHFVAELVRRDVVTDTEARAIFDEMFERVD